MPFLPLDKLRYPERIAREIQMRILSHDLGIGERLPSELELAGEFEVSRSVIREAMRILDGLGLILVKKGPKGGLFVSDVYHKPLSNSLRGLVESRQVSVDHIFMVRLLIEPNVAAEAAVHASGDDVTYLRTILEESEKNIDDPVFLSANRGKFHIYLAEATGNPVLEMFMHSLIEVLREYFYEFKCVEFEQKAIRSHYRILEAVKNRQPEQARQLMTDDIMEIKGLVKTMDKTL